MKTTRSVVGGEEGIRGQVFDTLVPDTADWKLLSRLEEFGAGLV